ncbi:MAG: type II toxin-antitoxin system PemK/MazF family toxin [Cyanobacterium sp. T60_A2020_053]|nr:type II toxin-antitoxin system PemK/MazF family toxin [Cyanobacterium sp. T60_A2020_053]
MTPKVREIWLVSFPFSDLRAIKLRPALVVANHKEEVIILGIFSKIPNEKLRKTWVLISENDPEFQETGLKKTSLIRADKIATLSKFIFQRKLGILSIDFMKKVDLALKTSLNL